MEVLTPVNVFRVPKRHEGTVTVGLPDSSYRAFEILYFTYWMAPACAGLSKIFGLYVGWHRFFAPMIVELAGTRMPDLVKGVGLIELALAALVAARPKAGGWAAAAWLCLGILNMLTGKGHYGMAGCFAVMALGGVALAYLATEFDRRG